MKFRDAQKRAIQLLDSEEFKQNIIEEDPTMLKHYSTIKEINKSGYITFDSQAGRCHKGKKSFFDGKPYEIKERAYIIGFMKKDVAEKFIKEIGINTDKNAIYVPVCGDDIDIPRVLDIPFTITINEKGTIVNTHTSVAIPQSYANFIKKQIKLNKSEDVVNIVCWDTKWCRNASDKNGLFTDILKILKTL